MGYSYKDKQKKKKRCILIVSLIAILIAISSVYLAQTIGDNQGYRTISVVEVSGRVSVVKEGIEYAAYTGMVLQEGYEIVTSGNSFVRLVLDNDKYVKLEAGSKLVFEKLGVLGSGKTRLKLERGSLTTELVNPLKEDEEYIINTPNAILAVRGTFFRVDIDITSDGDILSDVLTYGGNVASSRIMPTGEVVSEEVLIHSGYKTTINMNKEDTHYVVKDEEGNHIVVEPPKQDDTGVEEDVKVNPVVPIESVDISNSDIIDIYFASENGHEMFMTMEDIKSDIKVREIKIEEEISIYEKAEKVLAEQKAEESGVSGDINVTGKDVVADDSRPLVKVEEDDDAKGKISANNGNVGLIDGGHIHSERKDVVDATCDTDGQVTLICRECNEILRIARIPAKGHSYGEQTDRVEVTCEEDGSYRHSCNECGYEETVILEALGHDYSEEYTVDIVATCIEEGSKSRHCSRCESITDETVIAKTDHAYTKWTDIEKVTCISDGLHERNCEVCGIVEREVLEALGHDYSEEYTIDIVATCVSKGSKSRHCSRCDSITDVVEIASGGHVYGEEYDVIEATCTDIGSFKYDCTLCGITEEEFVEALGHDYGNFVVDKAPTCKEDGVKSKHCSRCESVTEVTIMESPGHKYGEWVVIKEPTCDETGIRKRSCHVCEIVEKETIEALGHSYSVSYFIDEQPGCTTLGSKSRHCSGCGGKTDVIAIEAKGHSYSVSYFIDVQPGCTEAGSKSRHCNVCSSKTDITAIDPKGHNYGEEYDVVASTCESQGHYSMDCGNCGETKVQYTAVLGHNYSTGYTIDVQPGCTSEGSKSRHCSRCTSTTDITVLDPAGHNYGAWTEVYAAKCESEGMEKHICSNCSHEEEQSIAAKGHNYGTSYIIDVAATCTSTGSKSRHCSNCSSTTDVTEIAKTTHAYETIYDEENNRRYDKCKDCNLENCELIWLPLNEANFPDPAFRELLSQYDTNGEPGLLESELELIDTIYIAPDSECADITGIELLVYTKTLQIRNNKITSIDLIGANSLRCIDVHGQTNLTSIRGLGTVMFLEELNVGYSGLGDYLLDEIYAKSYIKKLNMEGMTSLTRLDMYDFSNLEDISLANCSNLTLVDFNGCQNLSNVCVSATSIENLNLISSRKIKNIDISGTNITSIGEIYLSDTTYELQSLNISATCIDFEQYADKSWFGTLEYFIADYASISNDEWNVIMNALPATLKYLSLAGSSSQNNNSFYLTSVDISKFTALETLSLNGCNDITNLDFSNNTNLVELYLDGTGITSIDISGLTKLRTFSMRNSQLTTLNISNRNSIPGDCLESIDVAGSTLLTDLVIENNSMLRNLDASNCTSLQTLSVNGCESLSMLTLESATSLTTIDAGGCEWLSNINLRECSSIISVDLTGSGSMANYIQVMATGTSLTTDNFVNCPVVVDVLYS